MRKISMWRNLTQQNLILGILRMYIEGFSNIQNMYLKKLRRYLEQIEDVYMSAYFTFIRHHR